MAAIETGQDSVGIVQTKTVRVVEPEQPLELECGKTFGPIDVAYETYGTLNGAGGNVVLICHALSGDAHVAGLHSPRLVGYHGRSGQGNRHEQVFCCLLEFFGRLQRDNRAVFGEPGDR
jgi:homoserine acetyltransferase